MYAALFVIVVGALAWLAPTIVIQTTDLTQSYPHLLQSAQEQIANPSHSAILNQFPTPVRDNIAKHAGEAGALFGKYANSVGTSALLVVTGAGAFIVDFAIVLGLASLFISDLPALQHFGLRLIPADARTNTVDFMRDVDAVIGGFVRGQLTIAAAIAILASFLLLALGVPYAVLLGILTALINILPIIGAFIALVPIAFIAFFYGRARKNDYRPYRAFRHFSNPTTSIESALCVAQRRSYAARAVSRPVVGLRSLRISRSIACDSHSRYRTRRSGASLSTR